MNRVSTVVAVLGAGLLVTACDIEQPSAGCVVQDSEAWVAKYDLQNGADLSEACKALALEGEVIGVFKYRDPTKPDSNVLAIRPSGLASRASRDSRPSSFQTSVGHLSSESTNDFCQATDMSVADLQATASADGKEDETRISYTFSNVAVYSAPRAPGTQLRAVLDYTRDGCNLKYKVNAMWPAAECVPGSTEPAESCGKGSYINPDMAVTCHPTLHLCVLAKDVPSFNE